MSVFNCETYVSSAISSILSQSFEDFEFIIINDGSTDGTSDILRNYSGKDNRIRLIEQDNKGLIHSLNKGIKLAHGKYITRQDADDISHKDRLMIQYSFLEKNDDISIAFCWHNVINGNDDVISRVEYSVYPIRIKKNLLKKRVIYAHGSVMFRKKNIVEIGCYNAGARHFEDYDLWVRAISNNLKISAIKEILYSWRITNDSISITRFDAMNPEHRDIELPYHNHLQNLYFRVKDRININRNTRILYENGDLHLKSFAKFIVCNLPFDYTRIFRYL